MNLLIELDVSQQEKYGQIDSCFWGFFFLLAYELALSGSWEFDQRQDQTFGLLPPKVLKKNYKICFVHFFNKLSCLISINSYN